MAPDAFSVGALEPQRPVSAGQEPTEDKPQGPVPQAGTGNKAGRPLYADPSGASSSHRCLQDGAGDVAFVKETTVLGKRRERGHGYCLLCISFLLFHCNSK